MAKSFKKFRSDWNDEWDNDVDDKDRKLQDRRNDRRKKSKQKFSAIDDDETQTKTKY
jgi:hypothetical protein